MKIIVYIVYRKENMKLTKKEKEFLIDWLSDDLDLATRDKQDRAETYGKFVVPCLQSILNKLTKKENEK
tara:strand:- start:164 stop:370 length:207 start_codon:yes stop_codon:yes gene_type:complete